MKSERELRMKSARRGMPRSWLWTVLIPIAFGLLSCLMGQDSNWDLRNYHLYNAYSFLCNRTDVDLAPAQLQSYFHPLLDVLYYLMALSWPPAAVGFLMGWLHGLNFLVVLSIARTVLGGEATDRTPIELAVTGCIGAGFLSELGNTMGDNVTALLVLGALALLLRHLRRFRNQGEPVFPVIATAGLLVGAAAALKLTNAIYVVGAIGAFATLPTRPRARMQAGLAFALGAAVALVMIGGPWWWKVWQTFGNPFFPQFNALFDGPLALPTSAGDTRWLPKSLSEYVLWPLIMTLDPKRVSDSPLPQIIWALLYLAALSWTGSVAWRRLMGTSRIAAAIGGDGRVCERSRYLYTFVGLSFLAWMSVFGVYRYLVAAELLAPLVLWLVLRRVVPTRWFSRASRFALIASSAVVLAGLNTWGHAPWRKVSFAVAYPATIRSERAAVLLVGDDPKAWIVPFLPQHARIASVASNFPESANYRARVRDMANTNPAASYGVIRAFVDRRTKRIDTANEWIGRLGLGEGVRGCMRVRWLAARTRWKAQAREVGNDAGMRCRLELLPEAQPDVTAENSALAKQAAQQLDRYGLTLKLESCVVYEAWIGGERYPHQWCRVGPKRAKAPA